MTITNHGPSMSSTATHGVARYATHVAHPPQRYQKRGFSPNIMPSLVAARAFRIQSPGKVPRMQKLAVTLLLALALPALAAEPPALSATGDFSNGNAKVVAIDHAAGRVTIESINKGGRNVWWHVRIDGLVEGQKYTLETRGLDPVGADTAPAITYDQKSFERLTSRKSPYTFTAKGASAYLSRNCPYTVERAVSLGEALLKNPHVKVLSLCKSEKDSDVPLLMVSHNGETPASRKVMWAIARQHAFASHSSWAADGLIRWAASDAPDALEFRKRFILYVVPIMDVDSVAIGAGGKDQKPIDFNRSWGLEPPPWRAVGEVQKRLRNDHKEHGIAAFFDLHNPYFAEGSHWYAPAADDPAARQKFDRFLKHYNESLKDAENTFTNTVKPPAASKGRELTSRVWAGKLLGSDAVTATIEITHLLDGNGKIVTIAGLQNFGAQLGRSVAATTGPEK